MHGTATTAMPQARVLAASRGRFAVLAAVTAVGVLMIGLLPAATATAWSRPTSSDFNGDGFADLAVGNSGDKINGHVDAGSVNVLYGSASGLTTAGNQLWSQATPGIADAPEDNPEYGEGVGDQFGSALAWGRFDADRFADLAIGVPLEGLGETRGAVHVLYGSARGLRSRGSQFWTARSAGLARGPESDRFGEALAAGDIDGDGYFELAIGRPQEASISDPIGKVGAVTVLRGSARGLVASGSQLWTEDTPGLPEQVTDGTFGKAVAIGDFDADGRGDLAVGAVGSTAPPHVTVLYGTRRGLKVAGSQLWGQDTPGIRDQHEYDDNFGAALAAGDFNGDRADDLAVGVSTDSIRDVTGAGGVNVIYGSPTGLTAAGNQFWNRARAGIAGGLNTRAHFGSTLAAADLDGDGFEDLVAAAPSDKVGAGAFAGSANVLFGTAGGLRATRSQLWTQDSPGIRDRSEWADGLGAAVALHDFDRNGAADLALGVPGETLGHWYSHGSEGAVSVIYGHRRSGPRAAGNQFWSQDTPRVAGVTDRDDFVGSALN